jgi:DNA-binding NarL/FixJ family response regulator
MSVDDHPLIRDGIAYALREQMDIELVTEATNGIEAVPGINLDKVQILFRQPKYKSNGSSILGSGRGVHHG